MINFFKEDIAKLEEIVNSKLEEERQKFILVEREKGNKAQSNGYGKKYILTLNGKLLVKVPLLRGTKQLEGKLKKFVNTDEGLDKLIAALLRSSITWEQTIEIIYHYIGIKLTHSTLNRVQNRSKVNFNIDKEKIKKVYQSIFVDSCYYKTYVLVDKITGKVNNKKINENEKHKFYRKKISKKILICFGKDENGFIDLLLLKPIEYEDNEVWTNFLEQLKKKGLLEPKEIFCSEYFEHKEVINQIFKKAELEVFVTEKFFEETEDFKN